MDNEQFIRLVRDPYVGLLIAAEVTARNLLPDGLFTDRQKMAGLVRELTETALGGLTPIAQDVAVKVVNTTAPPGTELVTLTEPPPPPPTDVFDVDAVVAEFISNTYGRGAILDPAYKTEIQWVRDQLTDAAKDQLKNARDEWIKSIVQSVGRTYNWKVADVGQSMPEVKGYQRIARPGACVFCRVVALNQYTTFGDEGGYHKNCQCYAVPIFYGQPPYRPDYYDEFERQYNEYKDKPPGDDYNARELQTPLKRRPDGTLIPDPAEERRRETFRNIRAGIQQEEGKAFGLINLQRGPDGEYVSSLAEDALYYYAGDGFSTINRQLRDLYTGFPTGEDGDAIRQLDDLFSRGVLNQDIVVYRGMPLSALGLTPEQLEGTTASEMLGLLIADQGFVSTSVSRSIAEDFAKQFENNAVVAKIVVPKGTPALQIETLLGGRVGVGEQEILLNRGSLFKITGWASGPPRVDVAGGLIPGALQVDLQIVPKKKVTIPVLPANSFGAMDVVRSTITGEFFSMSELDALTAYAGPEYSFMNSILRKAQLGISPEQSGGLFAEANQARIEALNRVFERSTSNRELEVYRGTDIVQFARSAIGMDPDEAVNSMQGLIGATISDPAFLSTTRNFAVAERFAGQASNLPVIVDIEIPKGTPIIDVGPAIVSQAADIGPWMREREILLPPGTKLRIEDIVPNGSDFYGPHILIQAEVVND